MTRRLWELRAEPKADVLRKWSVFAGEGDGDAIVQLPQVSPAAFTSLSMHCLHRKRSPASVIALRDSGDDGGVYSAYQVYQRSPSISTGASRQCSHFGLLHGPHFVPSTSTVFVPQTIHLGVTHVYHVSPLRFTTFSLHRLQKNHSLRRQSSQSPTRGIHRILPQLRHGDFDTQFLQRECFSTTNSNLQSMQRLNRGSDWP
jgi:hypothetical protein